MSTLEVNTITPQSGTTITIGGSGQTVTLGSGATQSGFGGTNSPNFSAYLSANQTVSHGTWTKVNINATVFDTDSAFNTSSNRFTIPTGKGGKYWFTGNIHFDGFGGGNTNNDTYYAMFYINGSQSYAHQINIEPDINKTGVNISRIINLSAGDYIELWCYTDQQTGTGQIEGTTSASRKTWFDGFKLVE